MSKPLYYQLLNINDDLSDWDKAIHNSPQSSIYSCALYLQTLAKITNVTVKLLTVRQNHQIIGGLPLVSNLQGKQHIMMGNHLLYYLAPFTVRDKTMNETSYERRSIKVTQYILEYLNTKAFDKVFIKYYQQTPDTRQLSDNNWLFIPSYTYRVKLSHKDDIFNNFDPNIRRIIRKCSKENWQFSSEGNIDDFYALHQWNMQSHKRPTYLNHKLFKQFINTLRRENHCRLFELRNNNGELLSSQLVLTGPFTISHTLSAATAPSYTNSGATSVLRWQVFQYLSDKGYDVNDLTDAHEASVARFKQQLGGQLHLSLVAHKTFSPYLQLRDLVKSASTTLRQVLRHT